MTATARARAGVDAVLLAVLAATAAAWLLSWWLSTSAGMAGTAVFLAAWVLMVAATMLPSVVPTARLWLRVVARGTGRAPRRVLRTGSFVVGYLAVWTATGLPAYALAAVGHAAHSSTLLRAAQGGAVAVAGLYQFSALKRACLSVCRSPLGNLLHYTAWSPRARDVRVGVAHGAYCAGCCWALMAVMAVLAAMDLRLAAGMAVVVLLEKVWRHGERFARALGIALLAFAPLVTYGVLSVGSM
jgi:predicted metal-binding membrane protein